MIVGLVDSFGEVGAQIISIVVLVASIAAIPLLAWAGSRLGMKLINRGVGK